MGFAALDFGTYLGTVLSSAKSTRQERSPSLVLSLEQEAEKDIALEMLGDVPEVEAEQEQAVLSSQPSPTLLRPASPSSISWDQLAVMVITWVLYLAIVLSGTLTLLQTDTTLLLDNDVSLFWWSVWASLLLGPFGTLARWQLSKWNRLDMSPIHSIRGTLTANLLGTAILGALHTLQLSPLTSSTSLPSRLAFAAVTDGFCGCFTTLSTLLMESRRITGGAPPFWWIVYLFGISILPAQLLLTCTTGIYLWSNS